MALFQTHRFIPAGAGNIAAPGNSCHNLPVHPRGCGEHFYSVCVIQQSLGSSPRVRGTCIDAGMAPVRAGSSPRVRGTFAAELVDGGVFRFIPAGAGNMGSTTRFRRGFPVHPRGCGEHKDMVLVPAPMAGSSPRVRGTCGRERANGGHERFIPAGAGNIYPNHRTKNEGTVHPRGCGEHVGMEKAIRLPPGSSPRVRGTWPLPGRGGPCSRFIPAGAGNILIHDLHVRIIPVHPRGCGEHEMMARRVVRYAGSSPRVRGT